MKKTPSFTIDHHRLSRGIHAIYKDGWKASSPNGGKNRAENPDVAYLFNTNSILLT
jgi:hypothetical protein